MESVISRNKYELQRVDDVLAKQRYPQEAGQYLEHINDRVIEIGTPRAIIEAYNLGIIIGKRYERKRKKRFIRRKSQLWNSTPISTPTMWK